MLRAHLFDQRHGTQVERWSDVLDDLGENRVLWVDLLEPSFDEEREVGEALGLDLVETGRLHREEHGQPGLDQGKGYLKVAVLAARGMDTSPSETAVVDCYVGENWVLTIHSVQLAVIDDFRELAEGEGEIGILDAPSFLAQLLEWVVTSYLRAFDRIEVDLEEFDVRVLGSAQHDAEGQIGQLVEVRRQVGELRRSLAPHREVFAALSKSEFDPLSSEGSAKRFEELVARTDTALAAARDAKDAIIGSFDVLIARTEHRTNEIMKVLTLASVLLLPGALIAGVMGMNFKPSIFEHAALFWVTNGVIVLIALATLAGARIRRWI
ncbi:MAG: magnesium transporter CorA family protein [Gaiellaceae bacterium]